MQQSVYLQARERETAKKVTKDCEMCVIGWTVREGVVAWALKHTVEKVFVV